MAQLRTRPGAAEPGCSPGAACPAALLGCSLGAALAAVLLGCSVGAAFAAVLLVVARLGRSSWPSRMGRLVASGSLAAGSLVSGFPGGS